MTMRLDIVTNDAGETKRREHARELGSAVVVAIYRLAKLAQMHNLSNQAFVQQLDQTHQVIGDYCLRSGSNAVNIMFAGQKAVFVAGQLLKGSRTTYDQAQELSEICEWLGGAELVILREVTREELHSFAEQVSASMRSERGSFRSPTTRIRLRPVADAARLRGLEIEDMPQEQRIIRTYASAVVILRRFFEDLQGSKYILPRRIKRVSQSLVDLSDGNNAAFLGVTEARNANYDEAGRAVNSAILAVTIARQVTQDRGVLSQIAMAAMMHDVARPRALALSAAAMAAMGMGQMGAMAPSLSEEQEDRLAAGAAAVLTALGRVNEPSITRTVVAFEALWLRRMQWLGQIYRGVRPPTIHARIMFVARRYNDVMTPEPGLLPPTADFGIAKLAEELTDPQDKTILRMLVASLGVIPLGTVVQLSTGEVGEVTRGTMSAEDKPLVRVSMDASGGVMAQPVDLDLAKPTPGQPARTVARVLSIDGWKKALDAMRAQDPHGHEGHGAVEYDEIPAWEQPSAPPPPPAPAPAPMPAPMPAPLQIAPKIELPTQKVDLHASQMLGVPERNTSPVPRHANIEVNSDDFSDAPPAPLVPSSFGSPSQFGGFSSGIPSDNPSVPAHESDPDSTSGVSVGTSPSMVGHNLDWNEAPGPPIPSERPSQGGEERTMMQASILEAPIVERPVSRAPEPTARGDLATTPLAHVLVYMLDHGLSGSVVFHGGDTGEHIVHFVRGIPAKVRLGYEFAQLGELLARAGAIEEDQIDHFVEGARRLGVLLGEYLIGHDVVARDTMAWVLETQVLEKVSSLANLPAETTYAYYRDTNLLEGWGGEMSLSGPLNAVLAVVRAWQDRSRIRATLNRVAKHPLVFAEESDPSGLILSDEELAIIELLKQERIKFPELLERQIADEDTVSALVYTMAVTRQFAFKGQKKGPMASRGSAPRPYPTVASAPPEPAKPKPSQSSASMPRVQAPAPAGAAPVASPKQAPSAKPAPSPKAPPAASPGQKPAGMPKLGLPSGGAAGVIGRGTIQGLQPKALEKALGTNGANVAAPAPPTSPKTTGTPVGPKPGAASAKPAAEKGSDPRASNPKIPVASPSASGVKISPRPGAPQIRPIANRAAAGAPAPKPIGPAGPVGASGPSVKPIAPAIKPIAGGPIAKAAGGPGIGLAPKTALAPAGAKAIAPPIGGPAAAKPSGPSSQRLPIPSRPSQQMQKVAAPVAPAEPQPPNAPTDPPPRGADAEDGTLALGSSGLGEAELAIEAMTNFRLADTALQRNDLASAARLAQKAIDADPSQAEYRALLAWVQALQSNNEAAFGEAVEAITALLQEDPSSDRGLLYRGRLHKKLGNMEDALADFEGVLSLTPNNREAQNEVRALKKK